MLKQSMQKTIKGCCALVSLVMLALPGFSAEIMMKQGLELGSHISGRYSQFDLSPDDPGAAVFMAKKGGKKQDFTVSVVGGVILLHAAMQQSEHVILAHFTWGGSVSSTGTGYFNNGGNANNIRLGAMCVIPAEAKPGAYSGTGIVRLTYDD